MLKKYYRLYLSAYENTDYLTKARSRLLLTFLVVFIILVTILQLSMLMVGIDAFLRVIRITPLFLIGLILSLFFLRKGEYSYASNIFLSVSTIVLMAGILSNAFIKPDIVYTTYIYFIYLAIAFCTLFCTSRFLSIITGVLAITDLAAFFIVKLKIDPSLHSTIQLAFIDSLVTLVLIYIVSLFTMKIANKNITYATNETEKNIRKNIFINDTLRKNSMSVVDAAREMNATFEAFSSNTQDQAAATEEITASMEEVLSGTEGISQNATAQGKNIEELTDMVNSLVAVMERLDSEIDATNILTKNISEKALSGEKSLKLMDSSISNISNSSAEMLNIVNIINDISDRINLLSLNAAIEAARAGEAGRGFAVVADEISKLADQTATSIRDIDTLIKSNDSYILEGTRNASGTITIINEIINNISNITEMIFGITASMAEHKVLSESINKKTAFINDRAVEIVGGTTEQKKATEEAVNTITSINELSQTNSSKIEEMISLSEKLVTMIDEMNKKIDSYEGNYT